MIIKSPRLRYRSMLSDGNSRPAKAAGPAPKKSAAPVNRNLSQANPYSPAGMLGAALQGKTASQIAPPKPAQPGSLGNSRGTGGISGGASGGASYGAVSPMSTGIMAAEPAPPPQPQSFDAWKAGGGNVGDSAWAAEDASAQSEYESLLASLAQQQTGFKNDWRSGLQSMGWKFGADGDRSGGWNPDDLLGAYGQSRNNMANDYGGRGLLDSTFYQTAQQDLDRRFNNQRDDMLRSYDQNEAQFASDSANAMRTREAAKQRALAEAYSRYTSGFGL